MQLTTILQLALLAASQGSASPIAEAAALTPYAASKVVKRATPAEVTCGPSSTTGTQQVWSASSVQASFNELVSYGDPRKPKPSAGGRIYPRQYGSGSKPPTDPDVVTALNAIPECVTGQARMKYYEFPLTNPVFAGGGPRSQGPDRVVGISPSPGQGKPRTFTYCLAMTHRVNAAGDSSFHPCTGEAQGFGNVTVASSSKYRVLRV